MSNDPRDTRLTSVIENGVLIIRIGVNTLCYAFEESEDNNPWSDKLLDFRRELLVIDPDEFAKDVCTELGREEEDGTTPLHLLLDKASRDAVEAGSIGVEEVAEVKALTEES